ncbi:MAG: hypothetical protein LBD35_04010 [Prevotellaceae bacterium]|jgi:hypothetical protein|nr:hypothetical protein [Prevotellaceae bacterium]
MNMERLTLANNAFGVSFSDMGELLGAPDRADVLKWIKGRIEYSGFEFQFDFDERTGHCAYTVFETEFLRPPHSCERVRSAHKYDKYEFSLSDMADIPHPDPSYGINQGTKIKGSLEIVSFGGHNIVHGKYSRENAVLKTFRKLVGNAGDKPALVRRVSSVLVRFASNSGNSAHIEMVNALNYVVRHFRNASAGARSRSAGSNPNVII